MASALPLKRTILITGSARRLGAALALALARDGHRLAIHYRTSRAEAEAVAQAIGAAGGEAAAFQNSLSSLAEGERLVRDVTAHFGGLDTLINNAGTFIPKPFEALSQADWDAGWASTAGSAFYATRAALPFLRASGRGRIVNLGDSMSDRPGVSERGLSYALGKTGLWIMTQTLAALEARHRVTVNMVSPGVLADSICDTPVHEMPLGRYGADEDVIHPVRFLLDEKSEALTGSNLHVGGGWNIQPMA
jgi:3-oxoacyl-[acyl-carrier protein] reductase